MKGRLIKRTDDSVTLQREVREHPAMSFVIVMNAGSLSNIIAVRQTRLYKNFTRVFKMHDTHAKIDLYSIGLSCQIAQFYFILEYILSNRVDLH